MTILIWISFLTLMLVLIAIDLGLVQRHSETMTSRDAAQRSAIWFALAMLFNVYIYFLHENNWLDWGSVPSWISTAPRQPPCS